MSAVETTSIVSFPQDAVTLIDGEYRLHDLALAEALGFADLHKIRNLIKRHIKALNAFGGVSATVAETPGTKGGRPGKEYHLNEHQAVFLCTKSETPNATALTIGVVETFVAVKRGTNAPALPKPRTLTNVQARTLQRMIRERWSDSKEREAAYERLKDRFEVPKYKQIAREDFEAAVRFIADDSPTPIPPFLRDGRYLLVVDGGKTLLRDADDKTLVSANHVHTLLRNFRTLTSQMRVCFGEVGDETMELPIKALKRKVTP